MSDIETIPEILDDTIPEEVATLEEAPVETPNNNARAPRGEKRNDRK